MHLRVSALVALFILIVGLVLAANASADMPDFRLSVTYTVPSEDRIESTEGYKVSVGDRLYVGATYEKAQQSLVGQRIGDIELVGAVAGFKTQSEPLYVFGEFGHFWTTEGTDDRIRDEAVVTDLNRVHGWETTRHFGNTSYSLGNGFGGRLGLGYEFSDYVGTFVSYRYLRVTESLDAWDGECSFPIQPTCQQWWQERRTLSLSAVEAGLTVRF